MPASRTSRRSGGRGSNTALFPVNDIVAEIKKQIQEENKKRVAERVAVMLKSASKRDMKTAKLASETDHYHSRTQKMLDALAGVTDAATLEAWFNKGF